MLVQAQLYPRTLTLTGIAASRPILSLVTFGAAPTVAQDVTEATKALPNVGWMLSFVNEFDMVPRADQLYIRSIIDMYRARYGLPCCSAQPSRQGTDTAGQIVAPRVLRWALPLPCYQLVGDIILSRRAARVLVPHDGACEATAASFQPTQFYKVHPSDFCELVFCDIGVHKRRIYLERMGNLQAGSAPDMEAFSDSDTLYTMGSRATTQAGEASEVAKAQ